MFPQLLFSPLFQAGWAALLSGLLLLAVLLRLARLAAELREHRRLGEEMLDAHRSSTETGRGMLMGLERALSARVADSRTAMEQRFGDFAHRMAREQGETRVQMEQRLREMAEAKQPSDKNRQPTKNTPRYIPPIAPESSVTGWFVKCRTMKRHASIGSQITV